MVNKSVILRTIVSIGLLAALVWIIRKDIGKIMDILRHADKSYFFLALSINIPLTILLSYRLKLLMAGQKIKISLKNSLYLTFIGFLFNNFLPTAIGGDIAKAHYASKKTNNRIGSYTAVFSDRLFGFFATLTVAAIGIISMGKNMDNNIVIVVAFVFILSVVLFFFLLLNKKTEKISASEGTRSLMGKIKDTLDKLHTAINSYRNSPLLLTKVFLISLFLQAFSILCVYLFILCLGGNISILKLFLIIPLIWTISMLPSLNGLGVREGAFVYFLKSDIGTEMAFAVSILWLGSIILYSIVGGILHLLVPESTS